ncbi:replication region DNA-binding N-term [Oryzisolibacter propanilivorax]|uniref:Replication region DNA-binding N-term n=1 Tax=Oryzisolibacter propanilivorax TaxID=1527607 RepID=A0A1G9PKR6_9BURK|nr:DNA-binding protein [Oryzisolibacter propanilivorax]SDL99380.1 replication region DNA-binding N-term [Oryzisolibacter propanilivorax]
MLNEQAIQSEIDGLKARISDTRVLYREVCMSLFFRHGITPTASRLYQYVRKGSMSVPAEALAGFWKELRERARVEIDHPGLPQSLRQAAGQAMSALWEQATEAAREELASLRLEAQADAVAAQARMQEAEREKSLLQIQLQTALSEHQQALEEARQLNLALTQERREHASTLARQQTQAQQLAELRQELQQTRQHFSDEMEKEREAAQQATRRAEHAERRALLDMDQERTARAALARQLEAARAHLAQAQQSFQAQELQYSAHEARLTAELEAARQAATDAVNALNQQHAQWHEAVQLAARHQAEAAALRAVAPQMRPVAPRPLRRNRRLPERGGEGN